MAFSIVASCVNCHACMPLCPSNAIYEAKPHFLIDSKKCTECEGDYADPQCGSICPIEGAILNGAGEEFSPLGTLTNIPKEILENYREMEAIRVAGVSLDGAGT